MSDYRSSRQAMITSQLRQRGITDDRVLSAINKVPREWFIPPSQRERAYADMALPIGHEQTISQPYMVAVMTQELQLKGSERVLEIGTGSGYQTAVLAELAAEVYTIERLKDLSLRARSILDGRGYTNIHYHIGDGTLGWPDHAPYDRIIVTAAAPSLPKSVFAQLAERGVIVIPLGPYERQQLQAIHKIAGRPAERDVCPCVFVKLLGAEGWPESAETERSS